MFIESFESSLDHEAGDAPLSFLVCVGLLCSLAEVFNYAKAIDLVSLLLGTLLVRSAVPWSYDSGGLSTPEEEIGVLPEEPFGLQIALELSSSSSSTSSSFLLS